MLGLLSYGYLGVLLLSFLINMIPFMSPSNMIIAGFAAIALPQAFPLLVGLFVALSAASAKLVHYYLAFFSRRFLSDDKKDRLVDYRRRMKLAWPILLLAAAASPIPDDPIVIPLGLMRYHPAKFFGIYFLGKTVITIPGAYMGSFVSITLTDILGGTNLIILSLLSTIVVTYILLKVDLKRFLGSKILKEGKED